MGLEFGARGGGAKQATNRLSYGTATGYIWYYNKSAPA
jgi:hypothetical protein